MTCKVIEAYEGEHLLNILVCEFEHITKKGGMCVIKVSFSPPVWFHGSKVEWNTTDCEYRMGYKKPCIPLKITATYTILNHSLINSISHLAAIVVYHHLCSQNMSMNGYALKTAYKAPRGGQFGMQQRRGDNSESSENSSQTANGIDRSVLKQPNQYHSLHGYGYPAL